MQIKPGTKLGMFVAAVCGLYLNFHKDTPEKSEMPRKVAGKSGM